MENAGLKDKFEKIRRRPTEFFRVAIGDGVELDGWCLLPPDFDPSKTYPLLVHVYGEPAGQTVIDPGAGITALAPDARSGRVCRDEFRTTGAPPPRAEGPGGSRLPPGRHPRPRRQAKAVRKVLSDRPYLDSRRVGVWGWSGGGSMSLNAIFSIPTFMRPRSPSPRWPTSAITTRSTRSVTWGCRATTWRLHARLAGQPRQGLKGNLLLIHGTGDDNCHFRRPRP